MALGENEFDTPALNALKQNKTNTIEKIIPSVFSLFNKLFIVR